MVVVGGDHRGSGTAETTRKTPGHYCHALMQSLAFNTSISFCHGLGFIWNSVTLLYYGSSKMGGLRWERERARARGGEKKGEKAEAFKAKQRWR